MKLNALLFLCLCLAFSKISPAQDQLPAIKLKNLSGQMVDMQELGKISMEQPVVVSFWATWCIPCVTELDNISDQYTDKQAEHPFKFYGVSIDDSRTAQRVKAFTKGKGWNFEVLMDVNSELKRELNITDVPHVIIIRNNKIVYRHTGYIAGEEENLFEEIKKY